MQEFYRQRLIQLYKNPPNWGKLDGIIVKGSNSACGDSVTFYVKLENGKINDIKFEGRGCVISIASSSLLAEYVKGKSLDEVQEMDLKTVIKLLGIDLSKNPARAKCALLPLHTLKKLKKI